MTSYLRTKWAEAPPIVRATLCAAWIGSKIGAISLATLFTITNLGAGAYYVAAGKMQLLELPGVIISGIFILVLSFLVSLAVTVPVSAAVAVCAYPFLRILEGMHASVFGIVGICVGTLVWLWMWWAGPPGNLYFGSWISVFAIGGLAACAAGFAFARQLLRRVT
jgi:hypothetical protein